MYTFKIVTTEELIDIFNSFVFTRPIRELHLHHMWKPTHYTFDKAVSIYGTDLSIDKNAYNVINSSVKTSHLNDRGFSDIAQHISLFPDGMWAIGRDWNKIPASATGHNTGAFMLEVLGNFDSEGNPTTEYNSLGYDKLEGEQLEALLKFSKAFITKTKLTVDNIRTHNEFTDEKTCFGNGLSITDIRNKVSNYGTKKAIYGFANRLPIFSSPDLLANNIIGYVSSDYKLLVRYYVNGETVGTSAKWAYIRSYENKIAIDGYTHESFLSIL